MCDWLKFTTSDNFSEGSVNTTSFTADIGLVCRPIQLFCLSVYFPVIRIVVTEQLTEYKRLTQCHATLQPVSYCYAIIYC